MKLFLTVLGISLSLAMLAQKKPIGKPPVTGKPVAKPAVAQVVIGKSVKDSASYALGQLIMNNFYPQIMSDFGSLNEPLFQKGIQDFLRSKRFSFDPEKMNLAIKKYGDANRKIKNAPKLKQYEPAIKAGNAFLDSVAKTAGAVKLPSGLIYKIKKDTAGPKPKREDMVSVYYEGRLIDGTKFDGNMGTGAAPLTFSLAGVIPGWTEGVQQMNKGSIYTFFIPYELGYGVEGSPPTIPPVSVLVFDIELLDIQSQAEATDMPPPPPPPAPNK
jgi:FKBP-type peptidyl-prolyl cis-trans isomerase FklB